MRPRGRGDGLGMDIQADLFDGLSCGRRVHEARLVDWLAECPSGHNPVALAAATRHLNHVRPALRSPASHRVYAAGALNA